MCGICGIFSKSGSFSSHALGKMTARLTHRGPDTQGTYLDNHIGLGHTRLSIIDLESGDQPLVSADGNLIIVCNGEIYNYVELKKELCRHGYIFSTNSDVEPIMYAYQQYGIEFVNKLNGMFAFALYDKKKKQIVIARDRLGIKPLFYTMSNNEIYFSSEIKSLISVLPHVPDIRPECLCQFMSNQFYAEDETIIKDVYKVLPGEIITLDLTFQFNCKKYWTPTSIETKEYSYNDAVKEFDLLFENIIQEHIRSDVPYGLFLSGGVDSAVILSLVHQFQEKPIRTYSVGYKDASMHDELDAAGHIARMFKTDHHPLRLDREALFNKIHRIIWDADDLMRDYACLPTSCLAEQASRDLKVVFTGEGGDEVFAGYRRYNKSRLEQFLKKIMAPGSGGFRTRSQISPKWLQKIYAPSLQSVKKNSRIPFITAWNNTPASWSFIQKSQYTDLITALPENLLVKVDRMLMSFGLEGRVPFLDHRVVEFGLSLPDQLKIRSGHGKIFLKRWAERNLPPEHLWKKKTGFHVPVGDWLHGDFLSQLEGKLLRNRGIQTWFQQRGIKDLFTYQRKKRKATRAVWSLMQFAIWHNMFIDTNVASPSAEEDVLDFL